jgi:glycosyltransferase involved in cell wall biosynthesis
VESSVVKVLIVAPSVRILGGQALQAACLWRHLKDEATVEVGFVPHNPALPRPLRWLQSIKYVRTIVTSLLYCALLLLRVPRYDVIHIFSASYFSFLIAPTPAMLIAKLFRKKCILNYHSGEAEDHFIWWPRTSIPLVKLADSVTVPSEYLVKVFGKFGIPARAISNMIGEGQFTFRERTSLQPRFLSNRNLFPLYNVACILRAFAIIQKEFPDASLVLAGNGSERANLERLAWELQLKNVTFTGLVAPSEMPKLYDEADIFLNSSNIDNMPGSILESFASGLPVITTDAGGIPYIVTHEKTGLLVPRGDHEALAGAAIRLLKDPALAAAITDRAYAETGKYCWSAVRKDWLHLYERLGNGLQFSSRPVPHEEPL